METLFLILLIAVIAMFVSNANLKARVSVLERRLDDFVEPGRVEIVPESPESETAWQPPARPERVTAAAAEEPESIYRVAHEAEDAPGEWDEAEARPRETLGGLFERLVAGRPASIP